MRLGTPGTPERLISWALLTEALSARTVWDVETTLSLDDELMFQIQEEAERQGCSVSDLLDRSARLLLGAAQAAGPASPAPVAERPLVIHAAFENGVLRPTEPVELPEASLVEVEVRQVTPPIDDQQIDMTEVYEILSRRYDTGETDIAARHNELEP
jgi:predicted DNA-binding antitoxin AbrB/MazE fold protein